MGAKGVLNRIFGRTFPATRIVEDLCGGIAKLVNRTGEAGEHVLEVDLAAGSFKAAEKKSVVPAIKSQRNFDGYCIETRRYFDEKITEHSGNPPMAAAYAWKKKAWDQLFGLIEMKLRMAWLVTDTSARLAEYAHALNYFRCFLFCIVHGHVMVSTATIHKQLWGLAASYEPPTPMR